MLRSFVKSGKLKIQTNTVNVAIMAATQTTCVVWKLCNSPPRLRPSGVRVQEPDLLHQKDGGEVPVGSPERHPEPSPDIQLQPQVSHLTQCGSISRWGHPPATTHSSPDECLLISSHKSPCDCLRMFVRVGNLHCRLCGGKKKLGLSSVFLQDR